MKKLLLLFALVFLCGCTTVNTLHKVKEFSLEGTSQIEWICDIPINDIEGNPLTNAVSYYQWRINEDLYNTNTNRVIVEKQIGKQDVSVRASCNGSSWSNWSRFPNLSIDSENVSFIAYMPCTYEINWTASLLTPFELVENIIGDDKIKLYPLIGDQGFYKIEGFLIN